MKNGQLKFLLAVTLFASVLSFNSCQKDKADSDTGVATDIFSFEIIGGTTGVRISFVFLARIKR